MKFFTAFFVPRDFKLAEILFQIDIRVRVGVNLLGMASSRGLLTVWPNVTDGGRD